MGLMDWLRERNGTSPAVETGAMIDRLPWHDVEDWMVAPSGVMHPLFQQTMVLGHETIAPTFSGYARQLYRANPIAFACVANRMFLFRQVKLKYRTFRGKIIGDTQLSLFEHPWPGGSTSSLLALAELYASIGGNAFFALREDRAGRRLMPMRPDWTAIVLGSDTDDDVGPGDIDAEKIGFIYQEGGPGSGKEPLTLLPEQVAHYMPLPDPEVPWRGMSWLTPVIEEVRADQLATAHEERYWEGGGTPNMVIRPEIQDPEDWEKWVELFKSQHEGVANKFKHLYLQMGIDAKPLGSNLEESAFVEVQSAGEVRICAGSMVPPAIVSVNKGLQGSALNAGNFEAAWRQFANGWAHPSWQDFVGCVAHLVTPPSDAELWYDTSGIPALQEDIQKLAEAQNKKAATINTLVMAGFDPDSCVDAVEANDFTVLAHTGLTPVQLLPDAPSGDGDTLPDQSGNGNGNGNGRAHAEEVHAEEMRTLVAAAIAGANRPHQISLAPPSTQVEFAKGAVQVEAAPTPDVQVTVEPPPPAEVSVTVEAPPPAEAPRVEFQEGAIQTTVEAPPPAEVNVTVEPPPPAEPAQVTIEEGAFQATVEAPPPAEVSVTVEAPPPADAPKVEFAEGAIQVEAKPAEVVFEEGAIQTTVEAPDAPPPAEVNVTVEAPPPAEVHVELPQPQRPRAANVKRDSDGTIHVEYEEEQDAE